MPVSERLTEYGREWMMVPALFLLLMARACAFGFQYYPQLDDYIQYHNFPSGGSLLRLHQSEGVLSSRPLAGVADFYIWGPMFGHLILGVALISLFLALTAVLLKRQLGRYFEIGPVFLVVLTLLPLGVEGTYWMSASTRVVCGLLTAALAAQAFLKWMDTGRRRWAGIYVVLQLLPWGFYEQSGVFSITLVVGIGILEILRNRDRLGRALLSLWGVPAMGLYFALTKVLATGGVYSSRAELVLPISRYWWTTFLPEVLGQMRAVFLDGLSLTLGKGFIRGVRLVLSGQLALWGGWVVLLAVLLWRLAPRSWGEGRKMSPWLTVLAGVLLFLAPLSIFFVLGNPWFSFRGAVTSFVGLALVVDTAVLALWKRLPLQGNGPAVLAALAALVFCMAGASEVGDYRDTWKNDQQIGQLVVDTLRTDFPGGQSGRVGILRLEPSYLPEQNFIYHEHIHGCTESAWSFQGLLTSLDTSRPWDVWPLPAWPIYRPWNSEANNPENFDTLYYFDGEGLERVALAQKGGNLLVVDEAGDEIGRVWEEPDGLGYFQAENGR